MPTDISADVAYIGGVWCEGVLYGIHFILFATVCGIFLNKSYIRGRKASSVILLSFSTAMFVLSTAHVALAVRELLQGFVFERELFEGGPPAFFRFNVFPQRKALYIFNTFLGDGLLIWRVYVIWGRNWKICVPSALLLIGTIICGIKTIVANATSSADSVFTSDILSWITSTFVLTIVTQITATALIASRIYYASRMSIAGSAYKTRYMSLVWLVVESGAIYTSAALIQLITYLLKMNAGVILEFMLAQLSAIVPILIVIRVGLGLANDGTRIKDTNSVNLSTFHATIPSIQDLTMTYSDSALTGPKDLTIDDHGSRLSFDEAHSGHLSRV
ncbi:hypothetical protein BDZ94DRAFT_1263229 [Collybia nuda]|uniref:Uncharacterized protein n=1 Tax=Collybia nuda TaxID=64659 RepID=A0A9P6CID2_9AGAR|nr:hypothetical protein BDZ94DRAFT_1263229 [Collybia nuda]